MCWLWSSHTHTHIHCTLGCIIFVIKKHNNCYHLVECISRMRAHQMMIKYKKWSIFVLELSPVCTGVSSPKETKEEINYKCAVCLCVWQTEPIFWQQQQQRTVRIARWTTMANSMQTTKCILMFIMKWPFKYATDCARESAELELEGRATTKQRRNIKQIIIKYTPLLETHFYLGCSLLAARSPLPPSVSQWCVERRSSTRARARMNYVRAFFFSL